MNSRRFIPYSSELEDDETQGITSRLWLHSPPAQMLRQNATHRGRRLLHKTGGEGNAKSFPVCPSKPTFKERWISSVWATFRRGMLAYFVHAKRHRTRFVRYGPKSKSGATLRAARREVASLQENTARQQRHAAVKTWAGQHQFRWRRLPFLSSSSTSSTNADRPISRATVVGCAISATRNYLKLHGPTKLNPLFSNNRATRGRGRHSSNFLSRAPPTLLSRCPTSGDFVPWRFLACGASLLPASKNLHTNRHPIKSTRPRSAISAELGRPNSLGRRVMRLAASVR
jgi:hypothetical protein